MYRIIGVDGRHYGPVTAEVVRRWAADGRVNGQTMAQAEGTPGWKPLVLFPEFADAIAPPLATGAPPTTNSLALWGFIFGVLSVTCGCCCCCGFPFNLLGIILSTIGLAQTRASRGRETGTTLAVVGLVLSLLSLVSGVVLLVLKFALSAHDAHWQFHGW